MCLRTTDHQSPLLNSVKSPESSYFPHWGQSRADDKLESDTYCAEDLHADQLISIFEIHHCMWEAYSNC